MKNLDKPKDLNPKKEIRVKNARCCTTCTFADGLCSITVKCKKHKKQYYSWKVCNFYKKEKSDYVMDGVKLSKIPGHLKGYKRH